MRTDKITRPEYSLKLINQRVFRVDQDIKALTFDVGGTVFDWQTAIQSKVRPINAVRGAEIDVPQFALDWRRRFFQLLAEVRAQKRDWCSADVLQLASLDDIGAQNPSLELTP